MGKFRITFSYNYAIPDYDWEERYTGDTNFTSQSDEIIVDKELTLTELLELKKKTEQESFGCCGVYTDIQVERIEEENKMVVEIAEMTIKHGDLEIGDKVVVLSRYDVSSMAPISADLCNVYANGKLCEVYSSEFKVLEVLKGK